MCVCVCVVGLFGCWVVVCFLSDCREGGSVVDRSMVVSGAAVEVGCPGWAVCVRVDAQPSGCSLRVLPYLLDLLVLAVLDFPRALQVCS